LLAAPPGSPASAQDASSSPSIRTIELVDDVALTHHQHAVAKTEQLGELAGNHDDPDPVGRTYNVAALLVDV
jgi:hypothetical protein